MKYFRSAWVKSYDITFPVENCLRHKTKSLNIKNRLVITKSIKGSEGERMKFCYRLAFYFTNSLQSTY